MKKLYIINDGELNGFTYEKYAKSHEQLGQLLSETAYVNINNQIAVANIPDNQDPSDWLAVDDTYISGMSATTSGWVQVETTAPDPVVSVAAWAAKSALARAGLTTKVEQAITAAKSTDPELYYKWQCATTFKSADPDLAQMAFKLNMTQVDLQNLFVAAKAIEASSS